MILHHHHDSKRQYNAVAHFCAGLCGGGREGGREGVQSSNGVGNLSLAYTRSLSELKMEARLRYLLANDSTTVFFIIIIIRHLIEQ